MKKLFRFLCIFLLVFLILVFGTFFYFQLEAEKNQNQKAVAAAPDSGRFIQVKDSQVFIQETGPATGPAYFFIHGTGSWSSLWMPAMKELSKQGIHCIAIDLPPFGYAFAKHPEDIDFSRKAQAERIVQVIKELNLKNVTLVGHSFGGRATLTAALLNPENIKGLVLVDIALGFGPQNDPTNPAKPAEIMADLFKLKYVTGTIADIATYPAFTKKLVSLFVNDENSITPQIEEMYKKPLTLQNKSEMMSGWLRDFILSDDSELVRSKEIFASLATVDTHIIWGDLDSVTPVWQGEELNKMFHGSQLHIIKGVGHIPMFENEAEFQKILNQTVKK